MAGRAEQCGQRYCELTGANPKSFKNVAAPCKDDHQFRDSEMQEKGNLSDVAARAVLKCLYLASVARPDILWAVNLLARNVVTWTKACDRRMERLISHIHLAKDYIHFNAPQPDWWSVGCGPVGCGKSHERTMSLQITE